MADIKRSSLSAKILIYLVMGIFTVMAVYPLIWLVLQSFNTTQAYLT
jgi:raffinose/stachyose/melibiose transport system permease protein